MKVKAYAKVNLALDILGVRDTDGYHIMDMVNAPVSLYDELDIEPSNTEEDVISAVGFKLPGSSTLHKALAVLREHAGLKNHYVITLTKSIPDKAGLGGGSADAAALIQALNDMEQLGLSMEDMDRLGFLVGADVPCCLHNAFTRIGGAGEQVKEIASDWHIPVLLVQGVKGISTPEAFARFESAPSSALDIDIVSDAVRKKDIGLLYQTMVNAFEPQAFEALDELVEQKEQMQDNGLVRVLMTGSGSCLMGFCVDDDVMEEACENLAEIYPFVYPAYIGPIR